MSERQIQRLVDELQESGELYVRAGNGRMQKNLALITVGLDQIAIQARLIKYYEMPKDEAENVTLSILEKRVTFFANQKKGDISGSKRVTKNTEKGDIVTRKLPTTVNRNTLTEEKDSMSNPPEGGSTGQPSGIIFDPLPSQSDQPDQTPVTTSPPITPSSGQPPLSPRVVHVNTLAWRQTPEDQRVYIGRDWHTERASGLKDQGWGNPFHMGTDGNRTQVIAKFRDYLTTNPELMARLPELRGKILGCWCKAEIPGIPDDPCHGDVLLELANVPEVKPATHYQPGMKARCNVCEGMYKRIPSVFDNWTLTEKPNPIWQAPCGHRVADPLMDIVTDAPPAPTSPPPFQPDEKADESDSITPASGVTPEPATEPAPQNGEDTSKADTTLPGLDVPPEVKAGAKPPERWYVWREIDGQRHILFEMHDNGGPNWKPQIPGFRPHLFKTWQRAQEVATKHKASISPWVEPKVSDQWPQYFDLFALVHKHAFASADDKPNKGKAGKVTIALLKAFGDCQAVEFQQFADQWPAHLTFPCGEESLPSKFGIWRAKKDGNNASTGTASTRDHGSNAGILENRHRGGAPREAIEHIRRNGGLAT